MKTLSARFGRVDGPFINETAAIYRSTNLNFGRVPKWREIVAVINPSASGSSPATRGHREIYRLNNAHWKDTEDKLRFPIAAKHLGVLKVLLRCLKSETVQLSTTPANKNCNRFESDSDIIEWGNKSSQDDRSHFITIEFFHASYCLCRTIELSWIFGWS